MILNSEFPEGFREAIKLRGFDTGTGRQPQGPVLTAKLQQLNRDLSTLLYEEGFTQAINEDSQTSSAAPIANDNINSIVQGVLAELSRRGLAQ
jgi:4-hydroxy-tetrahydrodipicolinate synthase